MINIREFLGLSYYISGLDEFLRGFRKSHAKLSASQRKEIDKHARIGALRDKPAPETTSTTLWDKF